MARVVVSDGRLQELYDQYSIGRSLKELAIEVGCCRNTMKKLFKKNGFQIRTKKEAAELRKEKYPELLKKLYTAGNTPESNKKKGKKGRAHPKSLPIGSRKLHRAGKDLYYWKVKTSWTGPWPYEHRAVMETKLGRKLKRGEIVHHKDENTKNNDPENLELLTHSEHSSHHGQKRDPKIVALIAKKTRLKPGEWSRQHTCCKQCGTAKAPHASKGICRNCYARRYRKNSTASQR